MRAPAVPKTTVVFAVCVSWLEQKKKKAKVKMGFARVIGDSSARDKLQLSRLSLRLNAGESHSRAKSLKKKKDFGVTLTV